MCDEGRLVGCRRRRRGLGEKPSHRLGSKLALTGPHIIKSMWPRSEVMCYEKKNREKQREGYLTFQYEISTQGRKSNIDNIDPHAAVEQSRRIMARAREKEIS